MTFPQPRKPKGQASAGEFDFITRPVATITLQPQGECIPDLIDLTPETQRVLDALRAAGGRPLIVGGAVRDALLSRTQGGTVDPMDVDIEVYGLSRKDVWLALPGR